MATYKLASSRLDPDYIPVLFTPFFFPFVFLVRGRVIE